MDNTVPQRQTATPVIPTSTHGYDTSFHLQGKCIGTMPTTAFQSLSKYPACTTAPQHFNLSNDLTTLSALKHVISWMYTYTELGFRVPLPLPAAPIFMECVFVHQVCHQLRLKREIRGSKVRDAIFRRINARGLTHREFAMVMELCAFDSVMVHVAKLKTTAWYQERGARGEWREIQKYVSPSGDTIWSPSFSYGDRGEEAVVKGRGDKGCR